jgi:hypothetical protein
MELPALRQTLTQKGWQPHHIDRAIGVLQSSPSARSDAVRLLDVLIYWGALALAVVGNFILSIAFIPVFLVFDDLSLVISVAIIAAAFGLLLDVVLREIEHLRHRVIIIPELFIPAIALINIYIITGLANGFASTLGLQTHNPWVVSIMYVCAFVLPHFVLKWRRTH